MFTEKRGQQMTLPILEGTLQESINVTSEGTFTHLIPTLDLMLAKEQANIQEIHLKGGRGTINTVMNTRTIDIRILSMSVRLTDGHPQSNLITHLYVTVPKGRRGSIQHVITIDEHVI